MFKCIRNFFKKPTMKSEQPVIPIISTPIIPASTPKFKFDIDVYEADDLDRAPESFSGVISESAETLRALYATCNQRIKIRNTTPVQADLTQSQFIAGTPPPAVVQTQTSRQPFQSFPPAPKVEPKYVTVSGIKMKIVGDVVYQKQWVRASDDEAAEFRVVSDKTNKLVNLIDKHVELEKWIKIED